MTSKKKLQSNKRNAQKSTGPRTERGKRHSSSNAVTLGLFSPRWLPFENPPDAKRKIDSLFAELDPQGEFATVIFNQLVGDLIRLSRLNRGEHAHLEELMVSAAVERENSDDAIDDKDDEMVELKAEDLNVAMGNYVAKDGGRISAKRIEWFVTPSCETSNATTLCCCPLGNSSAMANWPTKIRTPRARSAQDPIPACRSVITVKMGPPTAVAMRRKRAHKKLQPAAPLARNLTQPSQLSPRRGPDAELPLHLHDQPGSADGHRSASAKVAPKAASPAASPGKSLPILHERDGKPD